MAHVQVTEGSTISVAIGSRRDGIAFGRVTALAVENGQQFVYYRDDKGNDRWCYPDQIMEAD